MNKLYDIVHNKKRGEIETKRNEMKWIKRKKEKKKKKKEKKKTIFIYRRN